MTLKSGEDDTDPRTAATGAAEVRVRGPLGGSALMEQLASHCVSAAAGSPADSPAMTRAKECVLDLLTLALGGTRTEVGQMALRSRSAPFFPDRSDVRGCSVAGIPTSLSPGDAAGVNGLLGHALQCDDGMRRAHGHPGIAVIPAVLAAAQLTDADGPTFLRGVIAGYETFGRVGAAINPAHLSLGFHPSGTVGALAAAAGASSVLAPGDLNQIQNSMALAGSVSGGLMEYSHYGDMSSYFVGGNAARVGIDAALLARAGMMGPLTVLEGTYGMAATMANRTLHESELTDIKEDGPHILQTYTKLFPSCRHTHSAIEAALYLRNELPPANDIESVQIEVYRLAVDECNRPTAASLAGAESSLQMTVAAALVHGDLSLEHRSYERYLDDRVQALSRRVTVVHDPGLDAALPDQRPARLTVRTAAGGTARAQVDLPRGEPEQPLTWQTLTGKAWSACSGVLTREQFTRLESAVASLDRPGSLRQLTNALASNSL